MKNKTIQNLLGLFVIIFLGLTGCCKKKPSQDKIVNEDIEAYVNDENDSISNEINKAKLIDSVTSIDKEINKKKPVKKKPSQYDIVKKNIEAYFKEKMNDPKSYEFVKLQLIDSVTYSHNIEYRKKQNLRSLDWDLSSIERQEKYKLEIPSLYKEKEVEDLRAKIKKTEIVLSKIDSLANLLGDRKFDAASYTYIFSFRGNNTFGAKVLNEYLVQTSPSPDFKIIKIGFNKDDLYVNPNDFPGYIEMMLKEKYPDAKR